MKKSFLLILLAGACLSQTGEATKGSAQPKKEEFALPLAEGDAEDGQTSLLPYTGMIVDNDTFIEHSAFDENQSESQIDTTQNKNYFSQLVNTHPLVVRTKIASYLTVCDLAKLSALSKKFYCGFAPHAFNADQKDIAEKLYARNVVTYARHLPWEQKIRHQTNFLFQEHIYFDQRKTLGQKLVQSFLSNIKHLHNIGKCLTKKITFFNNILVKEKKLTFKNMVYLSTSIPETIELVFDMNQKDYWNAFFEDMKYNKVFLKKICVKINKKTVDFKELDPFSELAEFLFGVETIQSSDFSITTENHLKTFIRSIENNTSTLENVYFKSNFLGNERLKALVNILPQVIHLKTLDLSENNLTAVGAQNLASILPKLKNLRTLHVGGNALDAEGIMCIVDALTHLTHFTTLNISGNNIKDVGAESLAGLLPKLKNLTTLHVGENALGAEGIMCIVEALTHLTHFTTLNISGNNIKDVGAESLAGLLPKLTGIKTLILDENWISDEGAKYLATALKNMPFLVELGLENNDITPHGIMELCTSFSALKDLKILNLSWNCFGAEGAKYLATALPQTLQALYLGGNEMGVEGAKDLFEALKHLKDLRSLSLEGNELGREQAKHLADIFSQLPKLSHVNLESNKMGNEGKKAIRNAILGKDIKIHF